MQSHLKLCEIANAQFLRVETTPGVAAWRSEPARAREMRLAHDRGALLR